MIRYEAGVLGVSVHHFARDTNGLFGFAKSHANTGKFPADVGVFLLQRVCHLESGVSRREISKAFICNSNSPERCPIARVEFNDAAENLTGTLQLFSRGSIQRSIG